MIFESSVLYDYKGFEAPETVGFEDGHVVSTVNVDKVITQPHNNERVVCGMTNMLYVPKLTNIFVAPKISSYQPQTFQSKTTLFLEGYQIKR